MKLRSKVSLSVGVLWLGLSVAPGCGGGPAVDTGPVEEPNVGPGGPPGIAAKGVLGTAKGDTKAASAPARDATKK